MVSNPHQNAHLPGSGLLEPISLPLEQLPIPQVYQRLESRPQGLSNLEVQGRLARFGANALRELPQKPLLLRLIANFTHMMALLL
jgi:P-type Ca2+ transporter type 2C